MYLTKYSAPFAELTLACDGKNIVGLWIEGQKYFCANVPKTAVINDDLPIFLNAKTWLDRYFNGEKPTVAELPLAPTGSEFQLEVWRILCEIPYGEVITYGKIAQKTGRVKSARAIGGAVGRNPISIIIPCHRVIGANGSLTGFSAGIQIKTELLKLEGVNPAPKIFQYP